MSSSPLLTPASPAKPLPQPSPPKLARGLVNLLALGRGIFGLGCLLAPGLTLAVFQFPPLSPSTAIMTRFFGVREIVIAGFLFLAQRRFNRASAARTKVGENAQIDVRRAIWMGVATDGLDFVTSVVMWMAGEFTGASFVVCLGTAGLMTGVGVEAGVGYWRG